MQKESDLDKIMSMRQVIAEKQRKQCMIFGLVKASEINLDS